MYIEHLNIKNFRNFKELSIEFSPGINFIIGQNGAGKTSILEAVSVLSNLRSFRNISDTEIIKWGEESYYCSLNINENDFRKFELGCAIIGNRLKKKFKIDNNEVKKSVDYYGNLLTVIFFPDDINIVEGPPVLRRRFFDSIISRVDKDYFNNLSDFKKILISRNKFLKDLQESKNKNFDELDIWDEMFARKSVDILCKRKVFIDDFILSFNDSYLKISGKEDTPKLKYNSTVEYFEKDFIIDELKRKRVKDIMRGSTSLGPQRDDYLFYNDRDNQFCNYASQGQRRTAVISLKIAEMDYIQRITEKKIVILVDDIFSELDKDRRSNLIEYFLKGNQVICTMVNAEFLDVKVFPYEKRFSVNLPGIVTEL